MDRWKRNSLQLLDNNRASQYFGRFFNIINNNNNNSSKTSESTSSPSQPSCPSPAWKLSDSFVSEEITPRRRKASAPRTTRPRPMSYNGPLFIEEKERAPRIRNSNKPNRKATHSSSSSSSSSSSAVGGGVNKAASARQVF